MDGQDNQQNQNLHSVSDAQSTGQGIIGGEQQTQGVGDNLATPTPQTQGPNNPVTFPSIPQAGQISNPVSQQEVSSEPFQSSQSSTVPTDAGASEQVVAPTATNVPSAPEITSPPPVAALPTDTITSTSADSSQEAVPSFTPTSTLSVAPSEDQTNTPSDTEQPQA